MTFVDGQRVWAVTDGENGILAHVPDAAKIGPSFGEALSFEGGKLHISAHGLTDAGSAILRSLTKIGK